MIAVQKGMKEEEIAASPCFWAGKSTQRMEVKVEYD